MNILQVWH